MHIYENSRWWRPPSGISKMCWFFFIIVPILTEFDGNVENLTENITVTFKMHIYQNSRWRSPPICISKMCCHFLTNKPILTKFSGNVESLTQNATVWSKTIKNAYAPKLKMAAAAILNFGNRLPFIYYWTNPHQIWRESGKFNLERNHYIPNAHSRKFNVAAAAILNSEKLLPFLYY